MDENKKNPAVIAAQKKADRFKPKLIKRYFDGKYRTFNVLEYTYEPDTGYITLIDQETDEWYNGSCIDGKIKVRNKAEVVYPRSYEEFLYVMYGDK